MAKDVVKIDLALAKKVLSIVSKGLSEGLGDEPGNMCVEAAITYAIGDKEIHDKPRCVIPWLRDLKININDDGDWESNLSRGNGLKRLAISQLGSAYMKCTENAFWKHVSELLIIEIRDLLIAKIQATSLGDLGGLSLENYADPSTYDEVQNIFQDLHPDETGEQTLMRACEIFVQALILMKVPGTKFLHLAPLPTNKKKKTRK